MGVHLRRRPADLRALLGRRRASGVRCSSGSSPEETRETFVPDPDASTEAEREAHRVDWQQRRAGEGPLTKDQVRIHGAIDVPLRRLRARHGVHHGGSCDYRTLRSD